VKSFLASRLIFALTILSTASLVTGALGESVDFLTRHREKTDSGKYKIVYDTQKLDPAKTALVVCDMWDTLWCPVTASRVNELAPVMNRVLKEGRDRGMLIVHSPSDTLGPYKDHPARKAVLAAKRSETEKPLARWVYLDPKRESPLPIDDEWGWGSEPSFRDALPKEKHVPQSCQNPAIEIFDEDGIGDSEQVFHFLKEQGIENVILMGVHTNKCVLGRPFGIRQLTDQGMNVLLMRDMTDSLYNSKSRPQVGHVRGTELVVEHIEKFWCPTVTSTDLTGEKSFRFCEDKRPNVVMIVSDDHYHAEKTLPVFAQMLREQYGCRVTVLHGQHASRIPQAAEINGADLVILFVRRLVLPEDELGALRKYLDAGGPLVALRTASHAFAGKYKYPEGYKTPAGKDEWFDFDATVLGGNYHNHASGQLGTDVANVEKMADHPILGGVSPARWHSKGSLYRTDPIAANATLLQTGSIPGETQPLTWIRNYKGGKIFYTGLGHPDDFRQKPFQQLLLNAIFWAIDLQVSRPNGAGVTDQYTTDKMKSD
jgi:nicotinamidase-related amidase